MPYIACVLEDPRILLRFSILKLIFVINLNFLLSFKLKLCNNDIIFFTQGSKGIRQWTINQCHLQWWFTKSSLRYITWWLKCLDTQPNEPTNQSSIKVPKVFKPTINKTSVIPNPMSPQAMIFTYVFLWLGYWTQREELTLWVHKFVVCMFHVL